MPDTKTPVFDLTEEGRYVVRTDGHSHILWGLDDGSRDLEMSLRMARKAVSMGVENLVATPHACHPAQKCDFAADEIRKRVAEFNAILKDHSIPLTIYPGMELLMDESIPELFEHGQLLTWADQGRYVLTELGFNECRACTWEVLDFFDSCGYTPIIAHPERYVWIIDRWDFVDQLEERGCFFQINIMSLNGLWGEASLTFAMDLMRRTSRWIVGTDSHSDHAKFWGIDHVGRMLRQQGIWTGPGNLRVSELEKPEADEVRIGTAD